MCVFTNKIFSNLINLDFVIHISTFYTHRVLISLKSFQYIIIFQSPQMSKHNRKYSDFMNLSTLAGIKRSYLKDQKENQKMSNRSFSNYQTKSSTTFKQNQPSTSLKTTDAKQLIRDIQRLLSHFYKSNTPQFYQKISNYLKLEIEHEKKKIDLYLNKLPYIQQSLQKRNYSEIQQQLLKQWRKNPTLYKIRAEWYNLIIKISPQTLKQFQKHYNYFIEFVGQLAYLYYRSFFTALQLNKNVNVLDRLTERTAHLIVTQTQTWCKMYDQLILPLLADYIKSLPRRVENFDVKSLQISHYAVDINAIENQLPKTTESIRLFLSQLKCFDKINGLISIRENLQNQITARQQQMLNRGEIKAFKILDKDDFISCLIYCVVKGDISLRKLGASLRYFDLLFGQATNNILSGFSCNSYLADLQGVFGFLTQEKSLQSPTRSNAGSESKSISTMASSEKSIDQMNIKIHLNLKPLF